MTTREIAQDAFDATIDGIASKCAIEGSKQAAVEFASEVFALTNEFVAAIADDGKIDDAEKASVKAKFADGIGKRVPEHSFWFLGNAWAIVKAWLRNIQDKAFM